MYLWLGNPIHAAFYVKQIMYMVTHLLDSTMLTPLGSRVSLPKLHLTIHTWGGLGRC